MNKLTAALILSIISPNTHAVIDVPDKGDTGFYDQVHCSCETTQTICPDAVAKPTKQIHLPRTETRAKQMPLSPTVDLKHNYRLQ